MRGCDKIWIEGDAKFLVETVNGVRFDDRYDMGGVTIIQAVGALFESCDITFVHREANEAADELCHVARRELKNCYWYGEANLPRKLWRSLSGSRKDVLMLGATRHVLLAFDGRLQPQYPCLLDHGSLSLQSKFCRASFSRVCCR
ncbi:hypothetical protein Droror1_Dr00019583 [Drosera rotundifolia]